MGISLLCFSPVFIGVGCNSLFSYEVQEYSIVGTCKFGISDLYLLPKNKERDEKYHIKIKAMYMSLMDNGALYLYKIDDSKMLHTRDNILFINRLKHNRYYQFNIKTLDGGFIIKKRDEKSFRVTKIQI